MPAWNTKNIAHLLSRTLFGYSKQNLEAAQGYSSFADLIDFDELQRQAELEKANEEYLQGPLG